MRFFAEIDANKEVYQREIVRDMPIINGAIIRTAKELSRENYFVWGLNTSIYIYSDNPYLGYYHWDLLGYTSRITLWFNKWLRFLTDKYDIHDSCLKDIGFTFRADAMDEVEYMPFERRAKFLVASQASENEFYKANHKNYRKDYPKYCTVNYNGVLYYNGKLSHCPEFNEQTLKKYMK